jgi:hypothetical protein
MKQIYKIPDECSELVEVDKAEFERWKRRMAEKGYHVFAVTRFHEIVEAKGIPEEVKQQAADLMWDEMQAGEKAGNVPTVVVAYNPRVEALRGFCTGHYHC